jgi:hypothetical protein
MMKEIERYFKSKVEVPLIRFGKKQKVETRICEEALLFSKYLRGEKEIWVPRIVWRAH